MCFVFLLLSFVIIIKSAGYLIDSASDLAYYLGISPLIIGLTVVAFGTSAPEASVNIFASLHNRSDITIGNIVGSNIANIGIVIGITAILYTIRADWAAIRIDIPFAFIICVIFALLVKNGLSLSDGLILGLLFFIYLNYLWLIGKASYVKNGEEREQNNSLSRILFTLIVGLAGVMSGGYLIVQSGVAVAKLLGVSEAFIGLTIIAFGTSLPELITCLVACRKEKDSIAIGNMVGSNIFNILFVLPISSFISPISFKSELIYDVMFMILLTFLLFVFSYTRKRISRLEGCFLVILYLLYFSFIYLRK